MYTPGLRCSGDACRVECALDRRVTVDEPHLVLSVKGGAFRVVSDDGTRVRLEFLEGVPFRPEMAKRFLLSHFSAMNLDNAVNADKFRLSDAELAGMDSPALAELILSYEAKTLS